MLFSDCETVWVEWNDDTLLDLNDLVCPGRNCNAITDKGVVVFRDSQHLTDTFVRMQVPFVRARMKQLDKFIEITDTDKG